MLARSTSSTRATCIRTWGLMHRRWWGDSVPILPLTSVSICAVAAQMKAGGYRSFSNYLDTMKSIHIQEAEWTSSLALCRRRCLASTQRGIGPARQSLELPMQAIRDLDVGDEPLVPGGPCCPIQWATLCCFHVLRGAESACSLASSMRLDWSSLTESFSLPVSKTDPQAVGCVRTWGCVCSASGPERKPLCPFHAAASLLEHHQRRFASPGAGLPRGFPLFPTRDGDWCSRSGFLGTIAELARLVNASTTDALGRYTVGEHTWRISGSRHLAALDVPLPIIKLLARWGGDTIMRYVQDAPLSSLTRLYINRVEAADGALRGIVSASSSSSSTAVRPLLTQAEVTAAFQDDPLAEQPADDPRLTLPFYWFGPKGRRKVHMVSLPPRLSLRGESLPCGRHSTSGGSFLSEIPDGASQCKECGSALTWASAVAMASAIAPHDDSD